ncbi:MAG: sulfur carrier protein ThiS [Actinobacteria bacterium]|nr:sulfur carrier protein ThiS [Actinomycetota bacterium]
MEVVVNGKPEQTEDGSTIASILEKRNIRKEMVAVEVNGEVVKRDDYDSLVLKDGDKVEFLFYMSGGAEKR